MEPPERFPPDDPREWLNRARSNLVRAKTASCRFSKKTGSRFPWWFAAQWN